MHLNHIAITTQDLAACRAFWEGVFRAKEISRPTLGVSPIGVWYRLGDTELHLQYRPKSIQKTDQHFALEVTNITELVDRARLFGRLVEEKEPIPGFVKRYFLYDPDDNRVELLQK